MITLDMVKRGYEQGIVKLIESPHDDGVVCAIGDNWFYFGGETAEGMSVVAYCREIPVEDIVQEIFRTLEDFQKDWETFEDEYRYYEAYLNERLKALSVENLHDKALQFVKDNAALAYEIFRVIDKEYYKEDIVGKLEDMGINVASLMDAEINKMAQRFEKTLDNNDGYWESYWLSAEAAIEEVMKEKALQKDAGWKTSDEMVDKALASIGGIGVRKGSGLFGLRDFMVDGERMELVVEICRFEDKEANGEYFGVYYWVGYYGDDSLFADWEYTSSLDVDELKKLISDLEGRDFTEDIRKAMKENSVEAVIGSASERCGEQDVATTKEHELEK